MNRLRRALTPDEAAERLVRLAREAPAEHLSPREAAGLHRLERALLAGMPWGRTRIWSNGSLRGPRRGVRCGPCGPGRARTCPHVRGDERHGERWRVRRRRGQRRLGALLGPLGAGRRARDAPSRVASRGAWRSRHARGRPLARTYPPGGQDELDARCGTLCGPRDRHGVRPRVARGRPDARFCGSSRARSLSTGRSPAEGSRSPPASISSPTRATAPSRSWTGATSRASRAKPGAGTRAGRGSARLQPERGSDGGRSRRGPGARCCGGARLPGFRAARWGGVGGSGRARRLRRGRQRCRAPRARSVTGGRFRGGPCRALGRRPVRAPARAWPDAR